VTHPARSIVGTAAAIALIAVSGCAKKPLAMHARNLPIERQGLDALPPLKLPAPATQPDRPASLDALQAYAAGRDALIRGDKAAAVTKLTTAIEADGASAIAWQDLGLALVGRENNRALAAFQQASA
jgi:hypothetical protein